MHAALRAVPTSSIVLGLQGCDGCGELGAVLSLKPLDLCLAISASEAAPSMLAGLVFRVDSIPVRGPLRHLGKLGCVRSDPYEPTSTGIGVGRGGAAHRVQG